MPNAKENNEDGWERLLIVGPTGSGKTSQIWNLPGRKFVYIFDPNTMQTIKGCDVEYKQYFPDFLELDATLKGFNKGAKSDTMRGTKREPTVYLDWVDDINEKVDNGFFDDYDWIIFDSLTFLSKATMDRQLYINGRYGDVEDLADYRVVGSKISDVFGSITTLPINIYCTGHLQTFQDDKTKKITTNLWLPGKARSILPLIFTDVWMAFTEEDAEGKVRYYVRTRPEERGLKDIRCSIKSLVPEEEVTLDFEHPEKGGVAALLAQRQLPVASKKGRKDDAIHQS